VLGSLNANARWATAEGAMASNAPESKKNARGKDGSRAPGKADLSEIPGIARRTRNMMAAHQSLDDASAVSEGAAETTDTSRLSAYSRLLQSRDVPSLPPPSRASRAPSTHTTSTKRSSSPVKSPLDLLTSLGKPVQYDLVEESVILKKLKKDAIAPVYRRIRALCHAQYIPSPMRDSLEQGDHDSMVEDDQDGGGHDNCDDAGKSDDGQDSSGVIDLCLPDSDYGLPLVGPQRVALHPVLAAALPPQADRVLFQLKQEFIILQEIVSTTREYIRINHSEAAWNSAIHYPLLRLATAHMDSVTVQDITRASISSKCSPDGKEFGDSNGSKLALPPSTKMVDYALTLSAPSSLPKTSGPRGPVHPWMDFVGRQSVINPSMPSSFNHTEYSPLRYSPAGLFVETKVDMGSQIEGRTQLGVWVAAWFKRVNAFRLSKPVPPPVLPVLLVHNESWDLYFAVDRDSWIVRCFLFFRCHLRRWI